MKSIIRFTTVSLVLFAVAFLARAPRGHADLDMKVEEKTKTNAPCDGPGGKTADDCEPTEETQETRASCS